MKTVVVGISGGVDSSVSAYLLKKQGYNVIGLFMVNWDEKDEYCTAQEDYEDVKRVCGKIGIPYYSVNFAKQYEEKVFSYFLSELKKGRTPNPDVLCNREIKFGPFLEFAKKIGADYIATGHYAKKVEKDGIAYLAKAKDLTKDQSYFLSGISNYQLSNVIFPLEDLTKVEVRKIASEIGLNNALKKDSTGICFIGERNFRNFLTKYMSQKKGEIQTLDGKKLQTHDGLFYYTIGQRRGLKIGGISGEGDGKWFVVKKDMKKNILYVAKETDERIYTNNLIASDFNWISKKPSALSFECFAKFRYRQPDQKVVVYPLENGKIKVEFFEKQRAITPGQFVVLYDNDGICYGGGIID